MSKKTKVRIQALRAAFNPPKEEGKSPFVRVDLQIIDGPANIRGRVVTQEMYLTGGATEITLQNLRTLGWSCNDVTELTGVGSVTADGGFYVDTYKGTPRDAISVYRPRPSLDKGSKAKFAAEYKALAASAGLVEQTAENKAIPLDELPEQPAAEEYGEAEGPVDDEDSPF